MDERVDAIVTILEGLEVKGSEPLVQAVLNRLSSFGYEVTGEDEWLVAFCIQKVNIHIMNSCNTLTVPEGLFWVSVDRACGEFLYSLNTSGKLDLEDLDLGGAVTQIKEGDVLVQFDPGSTDEEKFNALVTALRTESAGDLVCYRKVKW